MLRLVDASVRYGSFAALDDVSLELGARERLAVLGPSGSGKSTLLRAIAGLEPLAGGRVEWDGHDLAATPPHRREFGLMFQDYALFPHRDVRGNVAFGLEMSAVAHVALDERVDEVLALVGLSGYQRRRIDQLSGGEQQRVALARALAPTPRLLMLDEPLGALDRTLRGRLLDELATTFAALGLPIIYVTHDQEEALAVGDRVAVMRAGRIEAVLTPRELWHSPPTEFVARFMGLDNIAPYTLDDQGRAVTAWGALPLPAVPPAERPLILVRPESLVPDAGGPIAGVVEARTFRGDHTSLVVRPEADGAPPLEVHAAGTDRQPSVGDSIRLRVDPAGVLFLPRSPTG